MIDPLTAREVAVYRDQTVDGYPAEPPYGPAEHFPEYPFAWPKGSSPGGRVYGLVRNVLYILGLDRADFGSPEWNPLGEFIAPGDTVLVKPNWVFHSGEGISPAEALFVNASVIRPVLDYAAIALQGRGRIILADAPIQNADFELILKQAGVRGLVDFWASCGKIPLEVRDLRQDEVRTVQGDRIISRSRSQGDPLGYRAVNLGLKSHLTPLDKNFRSYRVTNYNPMEMVRHHNPTTHEYLISSSVLGADTVINLAKLKTHRKGGMTCALKNLVGINGSKDWLPHHRSGSPSEGGDEYAERNFFKKMASQLGDRLSDLAPGTGFNFLWQLRRVSAVLGRLTSGNSISEGSWYGNDTLWRTVLDLVTILFYADREGRVADQPVRRHLALVDAVVAGEGDGPLKAAPRQAGMLIAGANPLAVDAAAATLIGLNPRRIPLIARGFEMDRQSDRPVLARFSWPEVGLLSNVPFWNEIKLEQPEEIDGRLDFEPPAGWKSYLELEKRKVNEEEGQGGPGGKS